VSFVPLRVTLVAQTQLILDTEKVNEHGHNVLDYALEEWLPFDDDEDNASSSADKLHEFAGRGCYDAWARANPATRANGAYLANIIAQGHESVFGHAVASFYVTGVSRSLTHELVRHRFLVFSQRSQRFVDESDCNFVCPPLLDEPDNADLREALLREVLLARRAYAQLALALAERGVSRKQAREAARAVLPECTETRLLVSGNLRAWRDFIKLRDADGADAEIREFAQEIRRQLRERVAPNSVQDL
jgi:thymidylate synthase (FAD)